jgi:hypothetical protein
MSCSFRVLNTLYTKYFLNYQLKSLPFGVIQLFVVAGRESVLAHTVIHHLQLLADHYIDDAFHSVVGIRKVVRSDPIGLIHLFWTRVSGETEHIDRLLQPTRLHCDYKIICLWSFCLCNILVEVIVTWFLLMV